MSNIQWTKPISSKFSQLQLPETMTTLSLENVDLDTFVAPQNLETAYFLKVKANKIDCNKTLQSLVIYMHEPIKALQLNERLRSLTLTFIDQDDSKPIETLRLPEHLQECQLENLQVKDLVLPKNLQSLRIRNCTIERLHCNEALKYLELLDAYSVYDIKLNDHLEKLVCYSANELPSTLRLPPYLKEAEFNRCEFEKLIINAQLTYLTIWEWFNKPEIDNSANAKYVYETPSIKSHSIYAHIYLDDLRPIPKGFVGIRNYDAFVDWIERAGMPDFISFDHDLGAEKSGYDCAKWLRNYCDENQLPLPRYTIHSMNPVGKENIDFILKQKS